MSAYYVGSKGKVSMLTFYKADGFVIHSFSLTDAGTVDPLPIPKASQVFAVVATDDEKKMLGYVGPLFGVIVPRVSGPVTVCDQAARTVALNLPLFARLYKEHQARKAAKFGKYAEPEGDDSSDDE